jgi:GxxExxY protein
MERTQEKIAESERAGNSRIVHEKLSYAVIGCARRVHSALGPGFPENVYHRALCRELNRAEIPFVSEPSFEVVYAGEVCGRFKVDLLVDSRIVLELKAASDICDDHVSQCFAYLKATGSDAAILINFGQRRLQTKRLVMSKR